MLFQRVYEETDPVHLFRCREKYQARDGSLKELFLYDFKETPKDTKKEMTFQENFIGGGKSKYMLCWIFIILGDLSYMAISQQKFREIVFQLLFSQDFSLIEDEEMISFMMEHLCVTKKIMREAIEKGNAVVACLPEIDEKIRTYSLSYDFDRIAKVEKSVLRLAIYEMCYEGALPAKVAIAEAIRLTRKFSIGESSAFVNAVLDAIFQSEGAQHVCLASVPAE